MEVRRQARNSRPGPGLLTLCVSGLQGCRVAPSRLASPRSSPHDSLALPELGPMRLVRPIGGCGRHSQRERPGPRGAPPPPRALESNRAASEVAVPPLLD